MFGRRPVTPPNESHETVPVFTTDPHGAAMFAGIVNGTLGHLGARPVIDTGRSPWHGWTAAPQSYRGAAFLGRGGNGGGGRPVVGEGPRLDQERGVVADPIQSIFEQRMTARRFS